jgi:glycine oxidase
MLSPAPDSPEAVPLVPLARASLELYPEFIARVEDISSRSTGYRRDGALEVFFAPAGEKERDQMLAQHRRFGLPSEAISLDDARRMEPALSSAAQAAAWMPYEASVEPRALTEAVLSADAKLGVEMRPGAEVTSVVLESGRATGVIAAGTNISAAFVILAAGCYSGEIDWLARYAPTRPVRGQMLSLRPAREGPRRVLRSEHGYVVPREDGRVVAGSTLENAGFEKVVTPSGLLQILGAAVELAPALAQAEVLETWAGLRPDTPDHLPVLGPTDLPGLFIATGHYRNGILLAPITAKLVGEWLTTGSTSIEAGDFSPMRFAEAPRSASR